MHTLAAEFTILRVVNGETVAADDFGVTNGFVKPKLGKDQHTGSACQGFGLLETWHGSPAS